MAFAGLFLIAAAQPVWAHERSKVRVRFHVRDQDSAALPCRIHVWDSNSNPQRAASLPFWYDHFVCPGQADVDVDPGVYRYLIERGPEYERREGVLEVKESTAPKVQVTLPRIDTLRNRGWYSADLHIHRPVNDVQLLMRAEDLDIAPVITWWNKRNLWSDRPLPAHRWQTTNDGRLISLTAGEDERGGGALLFLGLGRPLNIAGAKREYPSPMVFVEQAYQQNSNVWIDIEKPFWWDVPIWLASGRVHSIGIANNHMCRDQMLVNEAWGKPRDEQRLPNPRGNGFWTQEIYYHILNSGLRLPPSAGSASGVLPNPVGYNRVYAHVDGPLNADAWWESLSMGRCFVTNGPLLICTANGKLPGSVLAPTDDGPLKVSLNVELTSRDAIERFEVIHNGQVVRAFPMDGLAKTIDTQLSIDQSGWFLVRAITAAPTTFRFASTAPFYVEMRPGEHHVSRHSIQFFQTWVQERIQRIRGEVSDKDQLASILEFHATAKEFWDERLRHANAD